MSLCQLKAPLDFISDNIYIYIYNSEFSSVKHTKMMLISAIRVQRYSIKKEQGKWHFLTTL